MSYGSDTPGGKADFGGDRGTSPGGFGGDRGGKGSVRGGRAFNDTRTPDRSKNEAGDNSSNDTPSHSNTSGPMKGGLAVGRGSHPDLARRDDAAVAAQEGFFGGVNAGSKAFNDEEPTFNDYAKDFFGIDNPGGFLGSSGFKGLTGLASVLTGGLWGGVIAGLGTAISSPRADKNIAGIATSALGGVLGGLPGRAAAAAGLTMSGLSLVDSFVTDLDAIDFDAARPAAPRQVNREGNRAQTPRTGGASAAPRAASPQDVSDSDETRRRLGPLNLRYAYLRGVNA